MTEDPDRIAQDSDKSMTEARLSAMLALRSEKWDRIKHFDSLDGDILKVYVTLMGAAGALVAWLASQPAGSTTSLKATLGPQQMIGIGTPFLLLSVYCIASVLRNYVNYLRALTVVNTVEVEMHHHGLAIRVPSVQFRPPVSFWAFLCKLAKTTRGPLIAIYFSCTPVMAWVVGAFIPAARYTPLLFAGLLILATAFWAFAHWRSFDHVDSAGFVVLTKAAKDSSDYLVAMLRTFDGKWAHPKGRREAASFGFLELASVTRWRELEEETGLHCDGKRVTQPGARSGTEEPRPLSKPCDWRKLEMSGGIFVSRYFLGTFADPEPEPWRGEKSVRLWALYIPNLDPPPNVGKRFSTSRDENRMGEWRSAEAVLSRMSGPKPDELRAPYVKEALSAALAAIGRRNRNPDAGRR